ncbi:hypothetical protein F5883DRAFT_219626 [Diaporthe sp. PMI_573]|nr:hypothetical protein F5883DRAFT_219626 [Diaporthaceae sp. PMI_573]
MWSPADHWKTRRFWYSPARLSLWGPKATLFSLWFLHGRLCSVLREFYCEYKPWGSSAHSTQAEVVVDHGVTSPILLDPGMKIIQTMAWLQMRH